MWNMLFKVTNKGVKEKYYYLVEGDEIIFKECGKISYGLILEPDIPERCQEEIEKGWIHYIDTFKS